METPEPPAAKPRSASELVSLLHRYDAATAKIAALRAAAAQELISYGKGSYVDEADRKAIVIVPEKVSVSHDLYHKAALGEFCEELGIKKPDARALKIFRDARDAKARGMAGIAFGKLFDRVVLYVPAAGFPELAPKFLPAEKARTLVDFCKVEKQPAAAHVQLR